MMPNSLLRACLHIPEDAQVIPDPLLCFPELILEAETRSAGLPLNSN